MSEPKILYVHFGLLPANGRSHNHLTGLDEDGVSVYEAIERDDRLDVILPSLTESACVSLSGCLRRPIYIVTGRQIGRGSDGESLLSDVEIVGRRGCPRE
jgi:hypothetical protein